MNRRGLLVLAAAGVLGLALGSPQRAAAQPAGSGQYAGTWVGKNGLTVVITQGKTGVEVTFRGGEEPEVEPGYVAHGVLYTTDRFGQATFAILMDNQTLVVSGSELTRKETKGAP